MNYIELSRNRKSLVDSVMFAELSQFNWFFDGKYACRSSWNKETKKETKVYMHRQILDVKKGGIVDHINNDKLDNRKENLRIVTAQENCMNQSVQLKRKHSKYKGVSYDKSRDKWIAYCKKDGKMYNLGRFVLEIEAAEAYNRKAIELFGEFAKLNVI